MSRFLPLLFIVSFAAAQFQDRSGELPRDTLATVGSSVITAGDFLERFELMPWPNKDKKERTEFTKLEFLHSIVAEKLLAMEAAAQNIGTDTATLKFQNNLERLFVRDELYKREIVNKIVLPPALTKEGMQRFPYDIEVAVLGVLSKQEGDLLFSKVTKSRDKKAALKFFNDSLYVAIDTVTVNYGFPEKIVEDAVYGIGKDSLSRPVKTEAYGWVMFSLIRRTSNVQNAKFSHPDRLHKVNSIVRSRIEDTLARAAFVSVTAKQRAEADPAIFFRMADSIHAVLAADSASYFSKGIYQFSSAAQNLLAQKLAPIANERFVMLASGEMSVEDVLQGLSNNNVVFPAPLNPDHIRTVLNNNIKTVIQNELLAREGLSRNLQQSENVRHDMSVWMDNYRSRILLRNIVDTLRTTTDSTKLKQLDRYIQESIDSYIGTLAKRYSVTINEEALKRVPTMPSSMVTWRHLGFGGRIIAVPQTMRQFEWRYEWKKQERINQ